MNSNIINQKNDEVLSKGYSDSKILSNGIIRYLELVSPGYLINISDINNHLDKHGISFLNSMSFFKVESCSVENIDKAYEELKNKVQKLFTSLYSINITIVYGLISKDGQTNLVLGIYNPKKKQQLKKLISGTLSNVKLTEYNPKFESFSPNKHFYGILSGSPVVEMDEDRPSFSLSSIMRSLNGENYSLLFLAKPISKELISSKISNLLELRDEIFAISKRNYSYSIGNSTTVADSRSTSKTEVNKTSNVLASIGAIIGIASSGVLGGMVGTGIGSFIGGIFGGGDSQTENIAYSISEAISKNESISNDVQNSFAMELINYIDKAVESFKIAQINGGWQFSIVFSSDNIDNRDIIQGCLSGELSQPSTNRLPLICYQPTDSDGKSLLIPKFFNSDIENPLCSYITSNELGSLCTLPIESVPDFEVKIERVFPLIRSKIDKNSIAIGNLIDGCQTLNNMPFTLSNNDLNKHTFICGLTGSGKTTSVKKILKESNLPFCVIEAAKKEYRNLSDDLTIYTFGRSQLNCPQINPFYVLPGVSLQTHIDFLKDLFNASFSLYGPMPYILEKCLYNVYRRFGWNLTLGYHPMLVNNNSDIDFYNYEYITDKYRYKSHKFLFPTMNDLKNEVERYLDNDLNYKGEIADNIKTAILVRLESLCNGTKGYSLNTNEILDFDELMNSKVIFELEGLADDSDKAFCVGLLIIFINEYRQIKKELLGISSSGLKHLIVIEEAHRLLSKVDTQGSNDLMGNPKGKAIEHFTNILAEMRSYGQGVIIAEQIPSKLAPDVIKNSSNKIVQRLVSLDDQQLMANSIGIGIKDAIQIGSLQTGCSFCHKEGMSLPVLVKIKNSFHDYDGQEKALDDYVTDEQLYWKNNYKFFMLDKFSLQNSFNNDIEYKIMILSFINTLLIESDENILSSIKVLIDRIKYNIIRKNIHLTSKKSIDKLICSFLASSIVNYFTHGIYSVNFLPSDEFVELLELLLYNEDYTLIKRIKGILNKLYESNTTSLAQSIVYNLILRDIDDDTNLKGTIRNYFINVSEKTLSSLESKILGI